MRFELCSIIRGYNPSLFGDGANGCTVRTGDVTPTAYSAGLDANMAAPIDLIIECSNASFIFILNITIK